MDDAEPPRAPPPKPWIGLALLALVPIALFWFTAAAAGVFVDAPFVYTVPGEWSDELLRSLARFPGREETALGWVAWTLVPCALALLVAALGRTGLDPLALAWRAVENHPRRAALGLAVLATLLAGAVSLAVVGGVPLLDDERAYLFQSELFASGRVKLPGVPPAFRNPMFLLEPSWMAKYTPGQSLLLLPAVALGLPHAATALLAGLTVYFTYGFGAAAFDEKTGLLGAALLAASPFLWCVSATLMPFVGAAACFSLCLWMLAKGKSSGRPALFAAAGAALGFLGLVRPLDAIALGLPIGVWLVVEGVKGRPSRALAFALGGAPCAALLLGYNWLTVGSAFTLPYTQANDFNLGFYERSLPGFDYEHTPLQALAQQSVAFGRLEAWLFGWPGSLVLCLGGAIAGRGAFLRLALAAAAAFLAAYTILPSTGTWDVGPTYYFVLVPVLALLAALGVRGARRFAAAIPVLSRAAAWLPVAGAFVALLTTTPVHLVRLDLLSDEAGAPWRAVAESEVGDCVVVVPHLHEMGAAGYSLGYPYRVKNRTGTAHLVRPASVAELAAARARLGARLPVYRLKLEQELFRRLGFRAYGLVRLEQF